MLYPSGEGRLDVPPFGLSVVPVAHHRASAFQECRKIVTIHAIDLGNFQTNIDPPCRMPRDAEWFVRLVAM